MKKSLILLISSLLSCTFICLAENNWNVTIGGSISHLCEKPLVGSDKTYNWGGGAFVGAGYEINFNSHWRLTPQIEFNFINNGATLNSDELGFYANHKEWKSVVSVNIPVIASCRFNIDNTSGLSIGVGPYLQECLYGKNYAYSSEKKEAISGSFSKRFNLGLQGELSLETKKNLSYLLRTQYPLLNEGWIRKTITLSLGVRYTFR